jgi:hypothetical protein
MVAFWVGDGDVAAVAPSPNRLPLQALPQVAAGSGRDALDLTVFGGN